MNANEILSLLEKLIDNEMIYLSDLAGNYADAVKGKDPTKIQASIGLLIELVAKQSGIPVKEFIEPIFNVINKLN